eukprot:TRINITY_DN11970_c0_g1_i1.p1 TRINITY_DN11970_c0_g1~~TRINITY_DN11970_c0_g1_i1.p1  ORF type:complete len:516 (-),score=48.92 TRINITY_DN11970_c0_g1_i1:181-1728(-)
MVIVWGNRLNRSVIPLCLPVGGVFEMRCGLHRYWLSVAFAAHIVSTATITVDAPIGALGLGFGSDQRVTKVGTSSSLVGQVAIGDRLLSINSQAIGNAIDGPHLAALLATQQAEPRQLVFRQHLEGDTTEADHTVAAPAGALAISFDDTAHVFKLGSSSPLLGKVDVGDRIVTINGASVSGLTGREITRRLKDLSLETRELRFKRSSVKTEPLVPRSEAQVLAAEAERNRCYYDAMAIGCPQSLGYDAKQMLCSCDYGDNSWFHVMGSFIQVFGNGHDEAKRSASMQRFKSRLEADGLTVTLDVGMPQRLECAEELAGVYPGTKLMLDTKELQNLAANFIQPQVRGVLLNHCVPGRIALQLLCLHAELYGPKRLRVVAAYAKALDDLFPSIEPCVERSTPWPFADLGSYVQRLGRARIETLSSGILTHDDAGLLSWWPREGSVRAKRPEESGEHYWPCVPLQDPGCFPAGTDSLHMSCSHCCDPGHGPQGDAACFVGGFTFGRCCRTPGNQGRFY